MLATVCGFGVDAPVSKLRVEVYRHMDGELAYRVLIGGRRILCLFRSDEERFPKRAARVGTWLVE